MSQIIIKILKNETEANARVLGNELSNFNKLRPILEQKLKEKEAEYKAQRLLSAAGYLPAGILLHQNRKAYEEAAEALESHDLLARDLEGRLYKARRAS